MAQNNKNMKTQNAKGQVGGTFLHNKWKQKMKIYAMIDLVLNEFANKINKIGTYVKINPL